MSSQGVSLVNVATFLAGSQVHEGHPLLRVRCVSGVICHPIPQLEIVNNETLRRSCGNGRVRCGVAAKMSDVAYHVNNLLSPVRFADAIKEVPARAVVVEVAPHALLQAVLKRAVPAPALHVPLVRRDHPDAG